MKRFAYLFICLSLLLTAWSEMNLVRADVPAQIHYQGVLVDTEGTPATGQWSVTFRLFDVPDEGDSIFEESQSVLINDGILSVVLGAQQDNALDPALLGAGELWLEVGFDGDEGPVTLAPRQRVVSHPYALYAGHADLSQQATNAEQLGGKQADAFVELASLGELCVAPDQLPELLADLGFVAGEHYTDVDVEAYLADNGYEAGATAFTTEDVQAYLDDSGYLAGPHYADDDVQAHLDEAGYVAGPHYADDDTQAHLDQSGYVAGPHYTDDDTQAHLDESGYVAGPHYADDDTQAHLDESGYVAGPHYADDDAQAHLDESGYVAGPHYSDGDAQAWLDAQGYVPGDHYSDGMVQIYLDAAGYVVGPHYGDGDVTFYLSDGGFVAGPHYADGDVQAWLDISGYVPGEHLTIEECLIAVADEGYLKPGQPIPPEMLPPDGLDEVSNGLLTTTFDASFASTGTPLTVPDAYLGGVTDILTVPDVGKIQDLTVSLNVQHADPEELKIVLIAPGGELFTLHDHGGAIGGGVVTSYDDETLPVEGDLSVLDDTYATGDWTLKLVDDVLNNEGTLVAWSIHVESLSEQSVRVNGDLAVAGNFSLDESNVERSTLTTLTAGSDSPADGLHTHTDLAVYFIEGGGIWSGGGTTVSQGGNFKSIYSGGVTASDPATAALIFEQVKVSCNHSPGWAGYVCCCAKGTISGDNGSFTLIEKCAGATNHTVTHTWAVAPSIVAASGGSLSLQGKSCGGGINFSGASITGDKYLPVKRLAQ
jgi:subtilisin-like proprotein convertase family protein